MVRATLVFAVVLIVLGVIGYAGAASDSKPVGSGNTSAEANGDIALGPPHIGHGSQWCKPPGG